MNRKSYRDVLDSAAGDSLSRNTNLWPMISDRLERKPLITTLRARPILALLIAMLIMFALSGVVYALGRAFGYIPGVGVVDQSSPLRVLIEPVMVTKQGITLTVTRVVADSSRSFIALRVEGIPLVEKGIPACTNIPELHTADGGNLENTGGGDGTAILRSGNSMFYQTEYVYSPIPVGMNKVTLVLSCVLPGSSKAEDLEVILNLSPAPANFVTPAVEIGATYNSSGPNPETTPTPSLESATLSANQPSPAATTSQVSKNSGLSLERVLELANAYILIGKFTDGGDLPDPLYISTDSDAEYLPRIEDANGNNVSFKVRQDIRPYPEWDVAYYWAYEIPKPVIAPLKITVDGVKIRKHNAAQMQFDTGVQPQAGQKWNLKQTVKLGELEFVLDAVTYLGNGYKFELSSENLPEGVTPEIEVFDDTLQPYIYDNNDSSVNNATKIALDIITLTSKAPPPTGLLTVKWGLDEFIQQPGPWSLYWTPSKINP